MTSQKGGGNGAGPQTRAERAGRDAAGRGSGQTASPPSGPRRRRGGRAGTRSPPHSGPVGHGACLAQASLRTQEGDRQTQLTEGWGTRAPRGEVSRPERRSGKRARAGLSVRSEPPVENRRGSEACACVYLSVGAFVAGKPATPEPGA